MTDRRQWPQDSEHLETPTLLLGRVLERSERTINWLEHISHRLVQGDEAMKALAISDAKQSAAIERISERVSELRTDFDAMTKVAHGPVSSLTELLKVCIEFLKEVASLKVWLFGLVLAVLAIKGIVSPADFITALKQAFSAGRE